MQAEPGLRVRWVLRRSGTLWNSSADTMLVRSEAVQKSAGVRQKQIIGGIAASQLPGGWLLKHLLSEQVLGVGGNVGEAC